MHSSRLPPDGAPSARFTAQERRTAALRAWSAARGNCRADARLGSLLEFELGAIVAAELDQLHRRRLPG